MTEEQISTAVAWATTVIAALLMVGGIVATRYFYGHRKLLDDNWVMEGIFRTCLTITVVAGWFTLARAMYLITGDTYIWISAIGGVMIVLLLLIPVLLWRLFRAREGKR